MIDAKSFLILIKEEDRTHEIASFQKQDDTILITFYGSKKAYSYSLDNCKIFDNPKLLSTCYINNTIICNAELIVQFEKYVKVFFNDKSTELFLIDKNEDILPKTNMFNYYQCIAQKIKMPENDTSLLGSSYEKIKNIKKDSALHAYLTKQTNAISKKDDYLLFPFGTNQSQYTALQNALNSQISIIEGPPGTGKTQTILNIIANLIMQGKSIAVVSNNNAATQNVFEKLQEYELDYLCATLGNKDNKESFIKNQPQIPEHSNTTEENDTLLENIKKLNKTIQNIFTLQNKKAKEQELLNDFKTQSKYATFPQAQILPKLTNTLARKLLKSKIMLEETSSISFFHKLKLVLLERLVNFKFFKNTKESILQTLESYFYANSISELEKSIISCEENLKNLNDKQIIKDLRDYSMRLLKNTLALRYKKERKIFTLKDLYLNSNDFLQAYPIVFSTTHSIVSSLNMNNALFDYIIIDESSQVDILTGVLALSIAKNAVIVGDKKQLSCIIDANITKEVETLNKEFKIEEAYNYLTHSLLDSITEVLSEAPRVLLKEHYRCHPKIIGFCNKQFYNDELLIFSEDNNRKDIIKVILASEGNHARGHYSLREIEIITEEIIPTLHQKASSKDIGIITPYREQKEKLEEYLGQDNNIQVDTVHKYQGREKECIIISLVDNQLSSFVDDPKMLNVSITRAKNFLYLVANKKILDTQGNVNDFIRYIQYNNFEITQSNINSIFDLLYKANEEPRESYLKNKKKISSYDSENLVYHAILEVLTDYPNLKVATHVRLGLLIKDTSSLNEQEQGYLNSALTHVDFVIYHAMNKEFLLAIEVDGYTFHNKDHKQHQRDIIKNNIFEKCKKTLLRLRTIGSNEKEKIRNELDKQWQK